MSRPFFGARAWRCLECGKSEVTRWIRPKWVWDVWGGYTHFIEEQYHDSPGTCGVFRSYKTCGKVQKTRDFHFEGV